MTDTPALKPTDLLKPHSVRMAVHARGDHFVWVPKDTPLSRILLPGYWAHNADVFNKGDRVEVCREDMSLDLVLRVVEKRPGLVMMRVMYQHVNDADVEAAADAAAADAGVDMTQLPEGYKLGYAPKGEVVGHYVHHIESKQFVGRGLKSKKDAMAFAIAHARAAVTPVA